MVSSPSFDIVKSVVEYSGAAGSEVRTVLTKNKDVHNGVVYVIDLGAVDPGATGDPASVEKTVGIHVPDHTPIKDVKINCINGKMGIKDGDCKLYAGNEAAYTTPALVDAYSVVATTEIAKASLFTNDKLDDADYDATEEDYVFLKLQLRAAVTAASWDYTKSLDNVPFYLIDFGVSFEEVYPSAYDGPTGNAPSLFMNNTNTEVFVVHNGSLQCIGCLANAMELSATITESIIQKGATKNAASIAVGSRENVITGVQSYGYSPWLLKEMWKGSLTADSDWIDVSVDAGWKKLGTYEFFIQTHTDSGNDVVIWIPKGILMADGNAPLGTEAALIPFKINILENFSYRMTPDRWDHIKLAVIGSVT